MRINSRRLRREWRKRSEIFRSLKEKDKAETFLSQVKDSTKSAFSFASAVPYIVDFLSPLFGVEKGDFAVLRDDGNIVGTYYKPIGKGPFNVIPFDCGLKKGVRELPHLALWLARMGYVVAGIYSTSEVFGKEGDHFVAGLEHLKNEPFVGRKMLPIGLSSGGAVALRLAANEEAVNRLGIVGAIAIGTYCDIRRMHYYAHNYVATHPAENHRTKVLQEYIDYENGATPETHPEVFAAAAVEPVLPHIRVPVLLIHGVADEVVPVDESVKLFWLLKAYGKDVRLDIVLGEGIHAPQIEFITDLPDIIGIVQTIAATKSFLRTRLR